jgi:predicted GIY-YIG superfamily endonuclease
MRETTDMTRRTNPHQARHEDARESPATAVKLAVLAETVKAQQEASNVRWEHFLERYERDQKATSGTLDAIANQLKPLNQLNERKNALIWLIGIVFTAGVTLAGFADNIFKWFSGK